LNRRAGSGRSSDELQTNYRRTTDDV